jgi:hypothetical protein
MVGAMLWRPLSVVVAMRAILRPGEVPITVDISNLTRRRLSMSITPLALLNAILIPGFVTGLVPSLIHLAEELPQHPQDESYESPFRR